MEEDVQINKCRRSRQSGFSYSSGVSIHAPAGGEAGPAVQTAGPT